MARLPWEPLGRRVEGVPVSLVAGWVGVAPVTVFRWRREGGVPLWAADRVAVGLGAHPGELWDEWWDAPDVG